MGGLGPTQDDLTREAVAAALGMELKRDHALVAEMYKRFAERRITMPENNAQQADILQGAMVLPNSKGTAPGQWLETELEGKPRIDRAAARARRTNCRRCGSSSACRGCATRFPRRPSPPAC